MKLEQLSLSLQVPVGMDEASALAEAYRILRRHFGDGAIPVTWDSYSYSISWETREAIGAFLDDLKANGLIPVGSEKRRLH